ncbi:uncharacterized protein RCC_11530 [Ramularia collo-cygni]|uniref:Uncharacterized protein n=1 Tax=Ramularia collo-cygni TaxID=112498 RepID=A0A2D3V8N2_9PEZI|nr:uncharacterized protein RCC_11530 [Ramularia collo-cygni]CZT25861.1 uncharacterized protein RCC_11530 [Ramularia collo-cygni]
MSIHTTSSTTTISYESVTPISHCPNRRPRVELLDLSVPFIANFIQRLPSELAELILDHVLVSTIAPTIQITGEWRPPVSHRINRALRTKYRKEFFLSKTFIFRADELVHGSVRGRSLCELWARAFDGKGTIVEDMTFYLAF